MNIVQRIKLTAVSILLLCGAVVPLTVSTSVHAQISEESKKAACAGIGGATGEECDNTSGTTVGRLLATAISILSWIVGVVAIFMVIIGGFKFIISNGDSAGIQSARNTIIYALIGLAVAVVAQLLVRFVLTRTGDAISFTPDNIQQVLEPAPAKVV